MMVGTLPYMERETKMTKLEQATKKAILDFMKARGDRKVKSISHIYPRAYVLSRSASMCLFISCPIQDAEPQIKALWSNAFDGGTTCRVFDPSLKAGDWCSVAYVMSDNSCEQVAVKAVEI